MNRKVLAIIICFGFIAQPCFAAKDTESTSTADHLVQDLQGFKSSIVQLEASNGQLASDNHDRKEHVKQAKSQLESLVLEKTALEKDAQLYASKIQERSSQLNSSQIQMDELKVQIEKLDQEMATKELVINKRLWHQQLIWEKLANAQKSSGASTDEFASLGSVGVSKDKIELSERLKLKERYVSDLQNQLDEQLLFSADPSVSVPKLIVQRDLFKKELLKSSQDQGLLNAESAEGSKLWKQLDGEVNALSKRRSELSNLLQILHDQYDGNLEIKKS